MNKVLFVCLGNICRSPLAEGIFNDQINKAGLGDCFEVDSAGTAGFHMGKLPDERALEVAAANGIRLTHLARRVEVQDFYAYDYFFIMDEDNYRQLMKIKPEDASAKVLFLRKFDSLANGSLEVPDPYYGELEGFKTVFNILETAISRLLKDHQCGQPLVSEAQLKVQTYTPD